MEISGHVTDRANPVRAFAMRLRRLQIDSGAPSVRDLERLTGKVGSPYTRGTIQDKLTGPVRRRKVVADSGGGDAGVGSGSASG